MTPATANRNLEITTDPQVFEHYGVAATERIFKGTFVGLNSSGYAEPFDISTSVRFLGVADAEADNTSGANAAIKVKVWQQGKFRFEKSGTLTVANLGELMQAIDDQTISQALATVTTAMTGADNDVTLTAKPEWAGTLGEGISIELIDPGANDQTLKIVVKGTHIEVSLATGGAGAITTTAALLVAGIQGNAAASRLVSIAVKTGDAGTAAVTALASTNLVLSGLPAGKLAEIDGSNYWLRINAA